MSQHIHPENRIDDLVGKKRPAEYIMFADFVSLPKSDRIKKYSIEFDTDFAEKYKVSLDAIRDWKKEEAFWERVKANIQTWGKTCVPDILEALKGTALTDGKKPEVELWLKLFYDYADKQSITITQEIDAKTLERRRLLEQWQNKKEIEEPNGEQSTTNEPSTTDIEPTGQGDELEPTE